MASQRQEEEINQGIPTPNPNLTITGKKQTFLSAHPLAMLISPTSHSVGYFLPRFWFWARSKIQETPAETSSLAQAQLGSAARCTQGRRQRRWHSSGPGFPNPWPPPALTDEATQRLASPFRLSASTLVLSTEPPALARMGGKGKVLWEKLDLMWKSPPLSFLCKHWNALHHFPCSHLN